jgi:hypothetical protein
MNNKINMPASLAPDLYHAQPHAPRHFAPRVWSCFAPMRQISNTCSTRHAHAIRLNGRTRAYSHVLQNLFS